MLPIQTRLTSGNTFGMEASLVRSISSRYYEVTGHAILQVSSTGPHSFRDWLFLAGARGREGGVEGREKNYFLERQIILFYHHKKYSCSKSRGN